MTRRVLKYHVAAALFSAAFLFGVSPADAYTYSGNTLTVDTIAEDENEFIVTGGANVISKNNVNPQIKIIKYEEKSTTTPTIIVNRTWTKTVMFHGKKEASFKITNLPKHLGNESINELKAISSSEELDTFNQKHHTSITITCKNCSVSTAVSALKSDKMMGVPYVKVDTSLSGISSTDGPDVTNVYKEEKISLTESPITVTQKSILKSLKDVMTTNCINVTENSQLIATGIITGRDIYSDKSIISTTKDNGESVITPGNITATGTLKSDTYIGAVSGAVSGNTVYSGGDIVSTNFIKAGGLAKGNDLNVAAINAASASITGNQSISGIFTTSGQAKLNGGASLGSKKITGLSAGTLSGTSTEAVNGAQLNTIKQKLASAGKSYTAGSDIAISSANAISVAKTGAIKSGNTGIVTGGTVYTETNSLNTKLNGLKDLVNSHQTTISSLQQQMGDLNQTISDINSNVALATSNLSNQLKNCLKSDMGNLSTAGKTAIRNIVSDSLKSMGKQSSQSLTSPVATYEAPGAKETIKAKDVEPVHTALVDKVDQSALSDITTSVDANTKQIAANADNIHSNATGIELLKSGKADVSGSNIDTTAYASKLGTGSVTKGNSSLVSGDTVYGALDKKADISYVDSRFGMMENQIEGIKQQATHDMNRVGASASALAALHSTAYDASDKLTFASGYGHYKNANTSALGAFYHPNEKTMVSVAGTVGNNDAMLSAGVSIKVGMSDHVDKVMVTPKMFSAQQVNNEQIQNRVEGQRNRLDEIERTLSAMMR